MIGLITPAYAQATEVTPGMQLFLPALTLWEDSIKYNFSRGYPRFNPGEFTVMDLLTCDEANALLAVASDPAAALPGRAVERLKQSPTIVLVNLRRALLGLQMGPLYGETPLARNHALPQPFQGVAQRGVAGFGVEVGCARTAWPVNRSMWRKGW